jgi:hypothetical protein
MLVVVHYKFWCSSVWDDPVGLIGIRYYWRHLLCCVLLSVSDLWCIQYDYSSVWIILVCIHYLIPWRFTIQLGTVSVLYFSVWQSPFLLSWTRPPSCTVFLAKELGIFKSYSPREQKKKKHFSYSVSCDLCHSIVFYSLSKRYWVSSFSSAIHSFFFWWCWRRICVASVGCVWYSDVISITWTFFACLSGDGHYSTTCLSSCCPIILFDGGGMVQTVSAFCRWPFTLCSDPQYCFFSVWPIRLIFSIQTIIVILLFVSHYSSIHVVLFSVCILC